MIVAIIAGVIIIAFVIFGFATGLFSWWRENARIDKKKIKLKFNQVKLSASIKNIDIDVPADNITFIPGGQFYVYYNNPYLDVFEKDGTLFIKKKFDKEFDPDADANVDFLNRVKMEIRYPVSMKFDVVKMFVGEGRLELNDLTANNLTLRVNKGNMQLSETDALVESKISMGRGDMNIKLGEFTNLDCSMDVEGSLNFEGKLFGANKFFTEFGSMKVSITRSLKFYEVEAAAKSGFVGFLGKRTTRVVHHGKPDSVNCFINTGNMTVNGED